MSGALSINPDEVLELASAHAGMTCDVARIAVTVSVTAEDPRHDALIAYGISTFGWRLALQTVATQIDSTAQALTMATESLVRQVEETAGAATGTIDVWTPWVTAMDQAVNAAGMVPGTLQQRGSFVDVRAHVRGNGTQVAAHTRYAPGTAANKTWFGSASRVQTWGKWTNRASHAMAGVSGAIGFVGEWQDGAQYGTGERAFRATAEGIGAATVTWASAKAGTMVGAWAGSFIAPPLGTAVGAALGFVVGLGVGYLLTAEIDVPEMFADFGGAVWNAGAATVRFVGDAAEATVEFLGTAGAATASFVVDVGGATLDAGTAAAGFVADTGGAMLDFGGNVVSGGANLASDVMPWNWND